jgi:hypothetical protein
VVNGREGNRVVSAVHAADADLMVIRPRLGTGWQTTVDDSNQEVRLRFKLFGLPLPINKRVPFSQVAHVAVVCRESWWSRTGPYGTFYPELVNEHEPMPNRGWRYELLMAQKGGRTTRLEVLKSRDTANDLVREFRRRTGLPSQY